MNDIKLRLDGLDAARYLAFTGMLLVNFQLAMQVDITGAGWINGMLNAIEGKASATFVLLSGIGLSLATSGKSRSEARRWTLRRSLFLLAAGLLNLSVFPADILHYYAVYFLLAIPLLNSGVKLLIAAAAIITILSCWLLMTLNYSNGWNWSLLQYQNIWTLKGAVRNLFFNGFHPIFPWIVFLLTGMALGQQDLNKTRIQYIIIAVGIALYMLALMLQKSFQYSSSHWLMGTTPMPPGPVYVLTGTGSALTVIGFCLLIARWRLFHRTILSAGRMTLSLYVAHIFFGMGTLEALGMLNGSADPKTMLISAGVFLILITLLAYCWSRYFHQGPLEAMIRRISMNRARREPNNAL